MLSILRSRARKKNDHVYSTLPVNWCSRGRRIIGWSGGNAAACAQIIGWFNGHAAAHARRNRSRCALLWLCCLMAGCTAPDDATPSGLVSRTILSANREEIVVNGGGREIRSIVLLPDGYGHDGSHAMLMALHNFGGDAAGFAKLIHAERVIEQGTVVVLPQAAGLIAEWQGPGITLTFAARRRDGHPVDDVAGLAQTLAVVRRLYRIDPADINLVGFSQGATLALTLARHLARQTPEPARRVFMVAGSVAGPRNGALEMPSADLFAYEPGRNGPQDVANFLTGEPGERAFLPAIIAANSCVLTERATDHGVDARTYRCRDGQKLVHLFEPKGEHAWPGQDAKYDSWLMGSGSGSHVDFTGLMADEIGRPRAPR